MLHQLTFSLLLLPCEFARRKRRTGPIVSSTDSKLDSNDSSIQLSNHSFQRAFVYGKSGAEISDRNLRARNRKVLESDRLLGALCFECASASPPVMNGVLLVAAQVRNRLE